MRRRARGERDDWQMSARALLLAITLCLFGVASRYLLLDLPRIAVVGCAILDDEPRDRLARERPNFAQDALVIFERDVEPHELPDVDVVADGNLEKVDVCLP